MRWGLAVVAVVIGCNGERVESATTDARVDSPDVACPTYGGNLIPDGDFATGFGAFRAESCQLELASGPCGGALRVYGLTAPGRASADYDGVPLAKGTKLHLRAWFKKGNGVPPNPAPSVFIRSFGPEVDGGERYDDYSVNGTLTDEWRLAERVFTLKNQQTTMQVMIDSYLEVDGKTHDFLVADISLVVEP
jgi:hypothetical protein